MSCDALFINLYDSSAATLEAEVCGTAGGEIDDQSAAHVHLFGGSGVWNYRQPMPVTVERHTDGSFLALDDLFGNYGQGEDFESALNDLEVALREYYELMADAEDAPTRRVFERFRTYLDRR